MADNTIYFDSTYRLRVVEEEKFKDTERLSEECSAFNQSELSFPSIFVLLSCSHARIHESKIQRAHHPFFVEGFQKSHLWAAVQFPHRRKHLRLHPSTLPPAC